MAGVFIARGMTISIPAFSIAIGPDGQPSGNVSLHVRFDVCPTWAMLALQHLQDANQRRVEREVAWSGTNEDDKAAALEREFEASMQAIMAAAISMDAFYALLQPHVSIPDTLAEQWRTKRTSRYAQVTEVLRRAFHLKPNSASALRASLKELYRLRDLAVHPSGKIQAPVWHPELNVSVEWRFALFRSMNAETTVNAATWILWRLAHEGRPKDSTIKEYLPVLKQSLVRLFPYGHPLAPTEAKR